MIRGLFAALVVVGLFIGASITLLGLLAPFVPQMEMINHFRPFILAGFVGLLAVALMFRLRRCVLPVSLFAALNAGLFIVPVTFQASHAAATANDPQEMKIVSFNMWVGNRPLDEVEVFLRTEQADVVLLQEIDADHANALLPKLRDIYPHQHSCAGSRGCQLALLSRQSWIEATHINANAGNPALLWARFASGAQTYRIASLHHAWPFQPSTQANHTDWLISWSKQVNEPLLIAGDFNLTPFSWKLSKFSWHTGLKRYSTYQRSWPGHRYAPAFLIDHVFSSQDFSPLDTRVGPPLSSDHLPIITSVVLDAG